ncbi:hypothetical protein [Kitasatospora sp. NPDC088134]|uniref:hypothetical protein n=1 Tax=Kitasatospora sp. NPDC088134 TaxID=3364071 RepID=UPI0037F9C273
MSDPVTVRFQSEYGPTDLFRMGKVLNDLSWFIGWISYQEMRGESSWTEGSEKELIHFMDERLDRPILTGMHMGSPVWFDLIFHLDAQHALFLVYWAPSSVLRIRTSCYKQLAQTEEAKAQIEEAKAKAMESRLRRIRAESDLNAEEARRSQRLLENTGGSGFTVYVPEPSEGSPEES